MTPLMFRGSILISEKILSYSDFINMPYDRFCKIEATSHFINMIKYEDIKKDNLTSSTNKDDVKRKLAGLPTVSKNSLTEEQKRFLNGS